MLLRRFHGNLLNQTVSTVTDPIVHAGRHFGRTVNAVIPTRTLVTNGLRRMVKIKLEKIPLEDFPKKEQREHGVFMTLLDMVPGLLSRLIGASDEEATHISDMLQKGTNMARADDTKGLKTAIIDWISPRGQALTPTLFRNNKTDRGFNHPRTGELLCPAAWNWNDEVVKKSLQSGERKIPGEQWPAFVYEDYRYDLTNPWRGLFRSTLLVTAYKFIFTSPSSAEGEVKATRSGNARIHGMTQITLPSLAYVATLVRFSLSSQTTFARSNCITDSERFYNTIMDLFLDVRELGEINELTAWWNAQVFAGAMSQDDSIADDAPLAVIRKRRDNLERLAAATALEWLAAATPSSEEETVSSGDGINAGSLGTADQGGVVGVNSSS
ncbi:hypothetical protein FIBSPDRAFT_727103 [Athelia psychrophila]|uniref:Uncharacterized protein n=1 Tax=Athelia psychrophila TaxID=1759441 RepID=A0A166SMF4_9AGAM|nr:hypothetical protein FIBSPDRAFT_769233 [Fibularhizoctonia sp. CBS 109695]KZP29616.1 hypothetical protein FIBSPDRAFT_727103 [Fibularhizoctonia sp. CBS 109695]